MIVPCRTETVTIHGAVRLGSLLLHYARQSVYVAGIGAVVAVFTF